MKTLGLTGGVGMGKSAAHSLIAERGVPVCDTDQLARDVVEPGQPALHEIRAAFGPGVLDSDGRLLRKQLGNVVFADPAARQKLESILHPRIRSLWRAQFQAWDKAGRPLAVVVIPLLFETGAERELDFTACVACSPATQRQRLLERGWSEEEINRRIESQWPIDKKINAANYVLWNDGPLTVLAAQIENILQGLAR